jgi:hypothetical protein
VEVFEPALFRDGERQVRETIQKSLENIRFNVQSGSTPAK